MLPKHFSVLYSHLETNLLFYHPPKPPAIEQENACEALFSSGMSALQA
jgi:hypothetical protein